MLQASIEGAGERWSACSGHLAQSRGASHNHETAPEPSLSPEVAGQSDRGLFIEAARAMQAWSEGRNTGGRLNPSVRGFGGAGYDSKHDRNAGKCVNRAERRVDLRIEAIVVADEMVARDYRDLGVAEPRQALEAIEN